MKVKSKSVCERPWPQIWTYIVTKQKFNTLNKYISIILVISAMEVGVINSSGHLDTNKGDFLTFPNYSDQTFSAKWRSTRDSVALPIQELPNSGKTSLKTSLKSRQ